MMNYRQVMLDLKTLVESSASVYNVAGTDKIKTVYLNANDRDYVSQQMPLLDIRLKRAAPDPKTNRTYYIDVILELELAVQDLTSLDEAATIRDALVQGLQTLFQSNPHFSANIDATIVGNTDFATGEDPKLGAYLSGAIMEVHVFSYAE